MISIHAMNTHPEPGSSLQTSAQPLPRALTTEVLHALAAFPVVVLTGARQTGKSTLIRDLLPSSGRNYRTLDDLDVLERAQREPEALVASKTPVTIDEIQRSPNLLLA